jgi:hydrogenase maturation protease
MSDPGLTPILVLGLGNDILTDDAVGLRVAAEVRARLADRRDVEVRATTEMGLALLDEMAGRKGVVIVDSIQTGRAPPGHVHDIAGGDLADWGGRSPHFLGVGETLAFGRMLGAEMPAQIGVVAIEVADPFTLGTELTEAVARAVPAAVACVLARVAAMLPEAS